MDLDRNSLKKQFDNYLSGYDADDPKIRLKISHSYRVAELSERIAENVAESAAENVAESSAERIAESTAENVAGSSARTVSGVDPEFAWAIGLLHDIGRFEQVRRYGTLSDADSVDHAQLGADLLFEEGLLERLGGDRLSIGGSSGKNEIRNGRNWIEESRGSELSVQSKGLRRLMEVAIRNHNAYRLADGLSEQERIYCDILRDADKIDIFRVLCDTPVEEIYNIPLKEMKAASVSDEVKECFLNRTAVLFGKRKTPVDKIVGHICLTFELVYPISRKIAREQGYVDRLLSFQSDNEETAQWFEYMRDRVWKEM